METATKRLTVFVGGDLHGQCKDLETIGPEYRYRVPNVDPPEVQVYRWLTIDTGDGPVVLYRYDRKE